MRHSQSASRGLGAGVKVKKPGLQEWEATFTRTHFRMQSGLKEVKPVKVCSSIKYHKVSQGYRQKEISNSFQPVKVFFSLRILFYYNLSQERGSGFMVSLKRDYISKLWALGPPEAD